MFDSSHRNVMTPSRARVFRTVMARAEAELTRLQETGPRVWMHGDLNPWNVMVNRGSVTVFDCEDVTVGRPVQDIATTLFYGRERPDYWELRNGFRRGCEAVLPWPVEYDGQLELLMAARSIMFVNYVIRTGDESDGEYSPAAYTDRVVKRLRTYLRDFPIRSC